MKRMLMALVAGAVLIGTGVPATATTDQGADTSHRATAQDWAEFFEVVGQLEETMAATDAVIHADFVGGWRYDECRFQSLDHTLWTQREERLTAACAVERWSVPGGLAKFMSEGYCESGYNRNAYNPNGHVGLYQHDIDMYAGRVASAQPVAWDHKLSTDWHNSRGHIVMTARYVHNNGWGAWDNYNSC